MCHRKEGCLSEDCWRGSGNFWRWFLIFLPALWGLYLRWFYLSRLNSSDYYMQKDCYFFFWNLSLAWQRLCFFHGGNHKSGLKVKVILTQLFPLSLQRNNCLALKQPRDWWPRIKLCYLAWISKDSNVLRSNLGKQDPLLYASLPAQIPSIFLF